MFLEIPLTDDNTKCYIKPFDIKIMLWNNATKVTEIVVVGLEDTTFRTHLTPSDIQEGILKLEDQQLETFFKDLGE